MLKNLLGVILVSAVFFTAEGEENIKLHLTDGKILTVSKIRVEKNGEISFLHPQLRRFMRIPSHLLEKMEYPKTKELIKADLLFREKKYLQSAESYAQCSENLKGIAPWDTYSCFYAAKAFFLAGKIQDAVRMLEKLPGKDSVLNDSSPVELYEGIFLLAELYCRKKEFEKVCPLLDKLIDSPRKDFLKKALLKKGEVLFSEEKWQDSYNTFSLYTILFPDTPESKLAEEGRKKAGNQLEKAR